MSASSAPTPAEGSVERMVMRMDEALVEHAQHDVDGDQRGQNEQRLVGERILERRRRALEVGLQAGREVQALRHLVNVADGRAQRGVGRKVEGDRHRGELSLVIDRKRLQWSASSWVKALSGTALARDASCCWCWPSVLVAGAGQHGGRRASRTGRRGRIAHRGGERVRAGRRPRPRRSRRWPRRRRWRPRRRWTGCRGRSSLAGILLQLGLRLKITWYWLSCVYRVLIWRCPIGVVERVVDGGGRDAQARGGDAVDDQLNRQAAGLLVGGHVLQLRQLLELRRRICRSTGSARRCRDLPACTGTACGSRGRRR